VNIQNGIDLFLQHQKSTVKKSTLKSYGKFLQQIGMRFSAYEVEAVSSESIGKFLEESTEGLIKATRHLRYSQVKALFNYIIEASNLNIKNPCNSGPMFKTFKTTAHRPRKIRDKETVDELIFYSRNIRDRLILELQARCGMRIGEVLNLRVADVSGRKLTIQEPKSGRDAEVAFMPKKALYAPKKKQLMRQKSHYMRRTYCHATDRVYTDEAIVTDRQSIPSLLHFCKEPCFRLREEAKHKNCAPRSAPTLSHICQQKWSSSGDYFQSHSEASGSEDNPGLSGQDQRY